MTSPRGTERGRGAKESGQVFAALRARWPLAFPAQSRDVRPLASSVTSEIAAAMEWSLPYGVLFPWKMAAAYCRAVLSHDQRIALDGSPTEAVDAGARDLATKRLAQIAECKAAKTAAGVVRQPKAAQPAAPPEAPAPLRDRVRASLLRRT